jgi:peptidoglycan hydrolase-like protein with peptidoglycan-binding domain
LVADGKLVMPAGVSMGYFGPLTQSALAAYQAANGIAPAVGYFGPITRANNAAKCAAQAPAPTTPTTPSTGLQGGEGYFDMTDNSLGSFEIDLGDSEVVYEVELEAVDSDLRINRVDFLFDLRPWLYFDEVNLLIDGSEVASLSANSNNFSEVGSNYRARFAGLDVVIREGDVVDLELEVKVKSSMAGTRDAHTVVVYLPRDGVRAIDGAGLQQYGPSSDFDEVDIKFNDTFLDGSMSVTISEDSPEDAVIVVDEDARTNNVEVLAFDIEAKGDAVEISDIDVVLTASSTLGAMIRRAYLYANGSQISSKAVTAATTTQTVVFNGLDRKINRNSIVEFSVRVDFNEASGYATPNTLEAELDEVRAENSNFEDVSETSIGIGAGEVHNVILEGLTAEKVSSSVSSLSNGQRTYTFVFDVTAHGSLFYFSDNAATSTDADLALGDGDIVGLTISSNASLSGGYYRVNKGQTRRVTVNAYVSVASSSEDGIHRVVLESLEYAATQIAPNLSLELGSPDYREEAFISYPIN